ncbi:MAG: hypothetical protein KF873_12130 [Gemmataceae bacterium]|nr:hypothetical protein [Gemmataceae bacterium]
MADESHPSLTGHDLIECPAERIEAAGEQLHVLELRFFARFETIGEIAIRVRRLFGTNETEFVLVVPQELQKFPQGAFDFVPIPDIGAANGDHEPLVAAPTLAVIEGFGSAARDHLVGRVDAGRNFQEIGLERSQSCLELLPQTAGMQVDLVIALADADRCDARALGDAFGHRLGGYTAAQE